ncbi:MAG: S8 family serine peptidase [Dokdonella sp.]
MLIEIAANLRRVDPYIAEASSVLGAYVAKNNEVKTDIWASRDQALDPSAALTPTTLAIWDSGVDTALFPDRLYTNTKEKVDGKDTDGNGFIDDIHGIAYDIEGNAVTELLPVFDRSYAGREAELRASSLGGADMRAGIDSAAAKAFRERLAALKPEQVPPFLEASGFYGDYSHGTLTAGVAMASNPAARLMVVRTDEDDYLLTPLEPTRESMTRWASIYKDIVDYLAANGVRVVNMGFLDSADHLDGVLEANATGKTADERRKIALELLAIKEQALTAVFRGAPQILFVAAAGNSNTDIGFARSIPADIALPNVLAVGAVDQAGDEANFTSYGERVRVYASGYQVASVLPGGSKTRASGTSMAAPQVTNLAAKLFALDPKLTPTDVIKLIIDGSTKSADGKRLLINPKASVALLEANP